MVYSFLFGEKINCDIMDKMNYSVRQFKEINANTDFSSYIIGADIGGTNISIGVAGIKNLKPHLLFSLDFKSQELDSLAPVVLETISYADENYNIKIDKACFGVAGVVDQNKDIINLTNVKWNIKKSKLISESGLKDIDIINDFQAVGYGFNLLDLSNKNHILKIREEKSKYQVSKTKALIGAGTGLGKSILIYNENLKIYLPLPSEGGHDDFPAQNEFEIELLDFIKKSIGISQPVTYEELLSGRGIKNIYLFIKKLQKFKTTKYTDEVDKSQDKANEISKYKFVDDTCKETFRLFTKYYARCAKNFVLDSMATGGLYIAGGIAIKNKEIFNSSEFLSEFENAYRRVDILNKIPVYLILNNDVGLYGACLAAVQRFNIKD
jgi:glucokinase